MQVNLKKIKPIGVVLILALSVLATVTLFTVDFGVPPRYTPLHDTEYYQESPEHMQKLISELEQNVFPNIPGIVSCEITPDGNALVIQVERKEFDKATAVLQRDFAPELFQFFADD